jgi:hypothetical protein
MVAGRWGSRFGLVGPRLAFGGVDGARLGTWGSGDWYGARRSGGAVVGAAHRWTASARGREGEVVRVWAEVHRELNSGELKEVDGGAPED